MGRGGHLNLPLFELLKDTYKPRVLGSYQLSFVNNIALVINTLERLVKVKK
jgi:hypothetical protein